MVPLLILGALASFIYTLYRATKKWGVAFLWYFAASVSFLSATGQLADKLLGPQWSWNFSHKHGLAPALTAACQVVVCFILGRQATIHRRAQLKANS